MVVALQLLQLEDLILELSDHHVLLLAFILSCEMGLVGGLGVVQVLAVHNGYNIIIDQGFITAVILHRIWVGIMDGIGIVDD